MDETPVPPIVDVRTTCPICGQTYLDGYRQGNVRVHGQGCPRCAPHGADARRHPATTTRPRRPHRRSA